MVTQYGSWWTYGGMFKLTNKVGISTLYSWRRADFIQNWQQSVPRVGVNYKLNDNLSVTPGYDWLHNYP